MELPSSCEIVILVAYVKTHKILKNLKKNLKVINNFFFFELLWGNSVVDDENLLDCSIYEEN